MNKNSLFFIVSLSVLGSTMVGADLDHRDIRGPQSQQQECSVCLDTKLTPENQIDFSCRNHAFCGTCIAKLIQNATQSKPLQCPGCRYRPTPAEQVALATKVNRELERVKKESAAQNNRNQGSDDDGFGLAPSATPAEIAEQRAALERIRSQRGGRGRGRPSNRAGSSNAGRARGNNRPRTAGGDQIYVPSEEELAAQQIFDFMSLNRSNRNRSAGDALAGDSGITPVEIQQLWDEASPEDRQALHLALPAPQPVPQPQNNQANQRLLQVQILDGGGNHNNNNAQQPKKSSSLYAHAMKQFFIKKPLWLVYIGALMAAKNNPAWGKTALGVQALDMMRMVVGTMRAQKNNINLPMATSVGVSVNTVYGLLALGLYASKYSQEQVKGHLNQLGQQAVALAVGIPAAYGLLNAGRKIWHKLPVQHRKNIVMGLIAAGLVGTEPGRKLSLEVLRKVIV